MSDTTPGTPPASHENSSPENLTPENANAAQPVVPSEAVSRTASENAMPPTTPEGSAPTAPSSPSPVTASPAFPSPAATGPAPAESGASVASPVDRVPTAAAAPSPATAPSTHPAASAGAESAAQATEQPVRTAHEAAASAPAAVAPAAPRTSPFVAPDAARASASPTSPAQTTPAPTAAVDASAGNVPPRPPLPADAPRHTGTAPADRSAFTAHHTPAASAAPGVPQGGSPWPTAPSGGGSGDGPLYPPTGGSARPSKSRSNKSWLLIAGIGIGALVGGAAGAGTTALIVSNDRGSAVSAEVPANVTVNDPGKVNQTTAIASRASASVVTISVQGGQSSGSGSGIVLDDDGHILTNNHVISLDGSASNPEISVTDTAGVIHSATIVGADPVYDLAVLKVEGGAELQPIEFADSDKLNVGDVAVAIGAPLGLQGTVTDGIVSALNRSISVQSASAPKSEGGQSTDPQDPFERWNFNLPNRGGQESTSTESLSLAVVQTDAAINPGNSGGALVNDRGQLIGVNVAIASAGSSDGTSSGSIGVGFAIQSNIAKRVAEELIATGTATHGLLGASVTPSTKGVTGASITTIQPGSPAEKGGLREGDIVTAINGKPVSNSRDLTAQVRALAAGSDATLQVIRDGKKSEYTVTLGQLPAS